ncbi:MAG: efflux RND transporter periplasmic adaptor subunit [Bacillota bacterium]
MQRSPKRNGATRRSGEADLTALIGGGETVQKPRGKKRWIFIGGGALLLAAAAAVLILTLTGNKEAGAEAAYREYTVERGDIVVGQNESSSVSLERKSVTFSVSTSVEEIYVKEGSSVKEGDPLMKLNADQIKIGLASYELELEQAALEVQKAKLDQQTGLLKAQQSYDSSVQDGKLASAQENLTVDQLKLTLETAQRVLTSTEAEYADYVALHASYPSDYAYLERLEERVEDYQDDVDEMQDDLDTINNYENKIEALQDLEDDLATAKTILESAIDTYQEAGGVLEADDISYFENYSIDHSGTSGDVPAGGNDSQKAAYEAALANYKKLQTSIDDTLESGISTIDEQIAKWQEKIDKILDSYSYASVKLMEAGLTSLKTKHSNAQTAYSDYKTEYNDTYGNIADEDDLAAKVDDLKAQVESAQLALTKAGVSLTTGSASAEQDSELAKNEASTAQTTLELTELQLQQAVDSAQEEYDTLNTEIQELKESIALDGVVLAPCTGMVASIGVEEGDSFDVTYNEDLGMLMTQTLCTLTNISDVYVPITISEEDILSVSIGQTATVTMNAFGGQTFDAEVDTITVESSRSGAATVSYTVNVRLEGDNEQLMYEGMSADVTLVQRAARDVLYINAQAVTNVNGVASVLVKGQDGEPVTTEVKTGFSDGRYVEILSGLSEGDTVLVESAVGRT